MIMPDDYDHENIYGVQYLMFDANKNAIVHNAESRDCYNVTVDQGYENSLAFQRNAIEGETPPAYAVRLAYNRNGERLSSRFFAAGQMTAFDADTHPAEWAPYFKTARPPVDRPLLG